MFPIRDHHPSGKTPLITYLLIAVNVLVFGYMMQLSPLGLEMFIKNNALVPQLIINGQNLITLLSSMFLHGSVGHLVGNMLFLNIFGDNLEDRLGHLKYLFYYLICGFGASFLQIMVDPNSSIPNLGASGAIAGIMGGYLVLFPRNRIDILFSLGYGLRKETVPAYFMLFYWFIAQLFSGAGSLISVSSSGGIAYFAHIGGFAVGWILIKLLRVRK